MMNRYLFVLVATICLVATSCSASEEPAEPDNGNKTETGFKVGDYYNHGLIKGVVFSTDENGEHGMIVSLDEKNLKWSTLETSVIAGATYVSLDYGLDNADGIKGIFSNWAETFPAVAWCSSKNPGSLNRWYLPAANELRTLLNECAGNPELVSAIEHQSGISVNPEVSYWSSTDGGGQIAYSYRYRENMSPDEDLYSLLPKGESHPCRCICRF